MNGKFLVIEPLFAHPEWDWNEQVCCILTHYDKLLGGELPPVLIHLLHGILKRKG